MAAIKGVGECLIEILKNPSLQIDIQHPKSGCNSFWFASFFGKSNAMTLLAKAGIDVLNKNKKTGDNALHIAMRNRHYDVVKMLINSNFPITKNTNDGISALIIGAS